MELLPASYTAHAQSADHSCFGQRTEPVRIDSSFTYLANPSICKMPVHRRDPNNQNVRKFRSKTQWIGSVQPEKFRKTGPPFEVDHFSRSDPSEFWLNGSRRFGEHRRVHRRSILNHHYSATPLNSFQSTWTFNQRRSSQFPLETGPTVTQWESRGTQSQFSENTCSEDDWRSRIFGTFIVKFLACLPLLGFSNI